MNADVSNQPKQPCSCELCQPNWHLGRSGNDFEAQPVEESRQAALEDLHVEHMAKVMAAQCMVSN